ncbi:hypothetical protein KBD20_04340 [Candidatus Saccharibacteria bacterium]|nr:hypothetical protein [Candidatus Saccharibacteria bacterium]
MRPEFEKYRGNGRVKKEMTAVRVPVDMRNEAELVALVEGDNLTGLMIEGLARVLEDRRSDASFTAKLSAALENRIDQGEARTNLIRSVIDTLKLAEPES